MAVNSTKQPDMYSERHIANMGFDPELQIPVTSVVAWDGQYLQRQLGDSMTIKITQVNSIRYLALAAPGTAESADKWQVRKIDETSGLRITWADGNASFDNVATDLTALSYS